MFAGVRDTNTGKFCKSAEDAELLNVIFLRLNQPTFHQAGGLTFTVALLDPDPPPGIPTQVAVYVVVALSLPVGLDPERPVQPAGVILQEVVFEDDQVIIVES